MMNQFAKRSGHAGVVAIACAGSLSVLLSAAALADDAGAFYIAPSLGYHFFDSDLDLDDDATLGLGLGYQFSEQWAAEIGYSRAETETDENSVDVDQDIYSLDFLYNFNRSGDWQPFTLAGVAHREFEGAGDKHDDTLGRIGGGVKYYITDALALRTDLRWLHSFDYSENDQSVNVALVYAFGGGSTAPVEYAVVDSDGDGVADDLDQCPDTPAGAEVDSRGCERDDDGDGVVNRLDACPDTRAGAIVDESGCYIVLQETVSIELNVQFDSNTADVRAGSLPEIAEVADFMKAHPLTRVELEGHTDAFGDADYNRALSQQRAEAVAAVLTGDYGIDASRVTAVGYGEEQLLSTDNTREAHQRNRRVVAVIESTVERMQ